MQQLVVTAQDGSVATYTLGPLTVIGRHPDCEVVLSDPMSSRRHCKIEKIGANFFVEDNNSANGTIFNSEPLKTRRTCNLGDVIQIGLTRLVLTTEDVPKTQGDFNSSLPMVSLKEDRPEEAPNFDFTIAAGGQAVSEAEESSADLSQLKRVTQRLKVLLDLGKSLGSTLNPRTVLQTCLDKLFSDVFTQAARGFILLYGPDGQLPQIIVSAGAMPDDLAGRKGPLSVSRVRNAAIGEEHEVKVSKTVVNRVRTQRQAVLVSDAAGDANYSPAMSMAQLEINSVMCAPLIAGTEDLGIIYIDTKDSRRRFGPDDLSLMNSISGQLAVVIKNAELARHAAQEAASRQNLQRFLSPHLVDQIIRGEVTVELGGSLKFGTVFFSDIVGFTRMASQMRPGDVVAFLNRYFQVMQEIIFSRGGTVDKTGGDQIMAFWGVLVETPQSAAAAATAALEMQNAMLVLNRKLASDANLVKPPESLGHGIGLNTGEFIAGNIGSERKIEFTVIGNAVNLAQRLESSAGRGQVFIGQGTFEAIRNRAIAVRMPELPMKNVPVPIAVYSLRGIIPPGDPDSGMTARIQPNAEQLLLSLPCHLKLQAAPGVDALVVRVRISVQEKSAQLQVLSERPLLKGTQVEIEWRVQEKPSLPGMWATVDKTFGSASESGQSTEAILVESAEHPPFEGPSGHDTMVLHVPELPDELITLLRPGVLIPTDLSSFEQVIRV